MTDDTTMDDAAAEECASDSTGEETESADEPVSLPTEDAEESDRDGDLEAAVEALAARVAELERTVAWMARQQAAETGRSACPACNTGGTLTVSRTPTGKKQVECNNCGETLN